MKKNILSIFIGICGAILAMQFIQPVVVNGTSMFPYLEDGDFLIMEKYDLNPDYDDVVILENDGRLIIKRIVGKPGDTISFDGSSVYVNGQRRQEDYISFATDPGKDVALKDNEYYVLGDNRPDSMDSRTIGPISKDKIKGIAKVRIYPKPQEV